MVLAARLLVASSLFFSGVFAGPNPVSVTLYYETLCAECHRFIPNKLFSTYTDSKFNFASLISKLTLIPYGFVQVINPDTHEYKCQHGSPECEGNKFHACAIKYIEDTLAQLDYITCLEKWAHVNVKYPINKCQEKVPDGLYSKILNCYNTDEGWDLFAKNGQMTTSFIFSKGRAFVPYVSYNNIKNDTLAVATIKDFRNVLCYVTDVDDSACTDNAI